MSSRLREINDRINALGMQRAALQGVGESRWHIVRQVRRALAVHRLTTAMYELEREWAAVKDEEKLA